MRSSAIHAPHRGAQTASKPQRESLTDGDVPQEYVVIGTANHKRSVIKYLGKFKWNPHTGHIAHGGITHYFHDKRVLGDIKEGSMSDISLEMRVENDPKQAPLGFDHIRYDFVLNEKSKLWVPGSTAWSGMYSIGNEHGESECIVLPFPFTNDLNHA